MARFALRWSMPAVACLMSAWPLMAQSPREVKRGPGFPPRFHDPSTPVREGDTWWVFSTGVGISSRHSKDLKNWDEGTPVLTTFPAWHKEVVPSQRGHLWAPDVVFHRGVYRMYYSVSSFGKNVSAIGLLTSPSLDAGRAACKWKDEGIVVRSGRDDSYNAIDPQIFINDDGRQWMVFGSFWKGIQLVELDPKTGKVHSEHPQIRQIAWNESIEAASLLKHGPWYYLFVNWGLCCRGLDSTYEMRIGRSKTVTGPYLDKDGRELATGGGSLFLKSSGDQTGPGHASFIQQNGGTVMFYHFYDAKRGGYATIGSRKLGWTKDGWPEAD